MGARRRDGIKDVVWEKPELDRLRELIPVSPSMAVLAENLNKEFGNNRTKNAVCAAKQRYLIDMPTVREMHAITKTNTGKNALQIIRPKRSAKFKDIKKHAYGKACHLLDIKPNRCRYPLPDCFCCNAPAIEDSSYCVRHHKYCYDGFGGRL